MTSGSNQPVSGPVAVFGATGKQGGATVDALLGAGVMVRAITRNGVGSTAESLRQRGAEVIVANLEDPQSVRAALADVAAAFLMTTFAGPRGPRGEVEQGRAIGDAAADVDLPFMVYSSVGGAERNTRIPHFESKFEIEQHLLRCVPLNVVRPTFFMENLSNMIVVREGTLSVGMPLPSDTSLQMISTRDIGHVAAALLTAQNPAEEPIEIAGDELTGQQIAAIVSDYTSNPTIYEERPIQGFSDSDTAKMFEWLSDPPAYKADFPRTRSLVPAVENFFQWVQRGALSI